MPLSNLLISGRSKQIVVGCPLALSNFKEKVRVGPPIREARAPFFFALEIQVLPEFTRSQSKVQVEGGVLGRRKSMLRR